jgi:hypothetical protein
MDVNGMDMMRRRRGRGGSGITSLRSAGAPAIAALTIEAAAIVRGVSIRTEFTVGECGRWPPTGEWPMLANDAGHCRDREIECMESVNRG